MSGINASGSSRRFKLTVTLEDSSNYEKWRSALQGQLFTKIRNTDMDRIVPTDTLDAKVFKAEFKEEWKAASKDADGVGQEPFTDASFVAKCFDHAVVTGEGFKDWIYDVFSEIRDSLCDDIKDQISGVALGDLVALLGGIKLALGHFETFDPIELDILYSKCTMCAEGGNDLMRFTAVLADHRRRLAASGNAVADAKAQRVLLRGLDQDIFESFIMSADRDPFSDYAKLEMAVKKFASNARVLAKLRELKPGVPHAVLPTRAKVVPTDADGRLDRMESILATMVVGQGSNRSRGPCWRLRDNGKCDRDGCLFSHDGGAGGGGGGSGNGNSRSRRGDGRRANDARANTNTTGMWCAFHKQTNHNTVTCHALNHEHPELKAFYAAQPTVPGSQQINTASGVSQAAQYGQGLEQHRFENINVTRVSVPQHIFAMSGTAKVNKWCVDGGATIMGTWDRGRCHSIRKCNVSIEGPNAEDTGFVCTEMGDAYVSAFDKATGATVMILVHDVLISTAFPFHIFSEIKAFKGGATATKRAGSWQFYNASGKPLLHASQHLLGTHGSGGTELYFVDEPPVPVVGAQIPPNEVKGVDRHVAPRRGASQGRLAGACPRAAGPHGGRAHHRGCACRLHGRSSAC